jgi:hypothetical protein
MQGAWRHRQIIGKPAAAAQQRRVFDAFQRMPGSRSRSASRGVTCHRIAACVPGTARSASPCQDDRQAAPAGCSAGYLRRSV